VTDIRVTAAEPDDSAALARIHVTSWQAAYDGIVPTAHLASLSIPAREKGWRDILAAGRSRTFVARRAAEATGFISFGACRDKGAPATRGEVWALYVAPHAWASGAGRALWETARVQLLHAGHHDVSLWVLSANRRGLDFYRKAGFARVPDCVATFELGGAVLEEMRLVFGPLSASPAIERAGSA